MVIEINKDIDKYQESVAMGLTAKQLIFSVAAVLAGGTIVLLTYKYVGLTGSAYIAIPIVAPIALGGFYTFQGMSFFETMKRRLHFLFGNREITYVSTEGEIAIKKLKMEEAIEQKQKEKLNKKKRNKKDLKKSSGAGL